MYRKFAAISLCMLFIAGMAEARVVSARARANLPLVVDSALDEPDTAPGDGQCHSTPSGQCTLRAAIQEANTLSGVDNITFAITGTISFFSEIIITDSVSITGPGADLLTLNPNYGSSGSSLWFDKMGGAFTLAGLRLSGNHTVGGLYLFHGALTIANVVVENTGTPSGLVIVNADTQTTVTRSRFSHNNSPSAGAISIIAGHVTIADSTISENTSTVSAGGISNGLGDVNILNSAIISNTTGIPEIAARGGGLSNGGTMRLVNSTVSGNSSRNNPAASGGGLANSGTLTVSSSTIANNRSTTGNGGGLRIISGTVTLQNTIIANNLAGGDCSQAGGVIVDAGHNLVRDNSCGFMGGADPMLGAIQGKGGPTPIQALLAGSPAIDGGNPAGCSSGLGSVLAFDQRGFFRAFDGDGNGSAICDIGAFEYHSTPPSVWIELPLIAR